jgi:hypothetical protein
MSKKPPHAAPGMSDKDHLTWLYRRKLEQWRRACVDQWNALVTAFQQLGRAASERGSVASGEWEFDRWFTQAHLFVVCVRHVWRFASLLGDVLDSQEIREAVTGFEERVPHAKDIRDFLEHFDDYAKGQGLKQLPQPEDLGTLTIDDEDPLGTIAYSFGGLELPLREALLASDDLGGAVLALLPVST